MKIRVTMKDPDTMYDAVRASVEREVEAMGLPEDEAEALAEMKAEKIRGKMSKWFKYGEYLEVECDTEAMTARVIEVGAYD